VREQAAEILFFRSLLETTKKNAPFQAAARKTVFF